MSFKKIKSTASRCVAAIALIVIAAIGIIAVVCGVVKLLTLLGLPFALACNTTSAIMFLSAISAGLYVAARPKLAERVYKWVHNFTHWNDEIYIIA